METYDIYARLSPNPEGSEKEIESVDGQIAELTDWIKNTLGGRVGVIYRDDGISATKRNVVRPGFEASLASPRIAVWHTDRYIRTTHDLLRVIDTGKAVHALHAGFLDLSTPTGRAVAKTVTAWAEFEGQHKAERQKMSHHNRAKSGRPFLGGSRPFGYDKGEGTYLVREDEAKAIVEVYENVLNGASLISQATLLNERGFTTTHGKPFHGSALATMLKHPRYAGILTYNGVEMGKGNWPAIVPEETFRAVEKVLASPSRRTPGPRLGRGGRVHLLVGLATCGVCEQTVRTQYRGGRKGDPGAYTTYTCPKGHASARTALMDDVVRDLIVAGLSGDPRVLARMGSSVSDEDVEDLRKQLDRRRAKAEEIQAMYEEDEIDRAEFLDMRRANNEKVTALQRQLAEIGFGESVASLLDVEDVRAEWGRLDVGKKHAIASAFFEEITVLPRGKAANGDFPARAQFWSQGRLLLDLGA